MKKFYDIELIAVVTLLVFAVVISLYHISDEGYLGISNVGWSTIWALAENGLSLMLCVIIGLFTVNPIRGMIRYVMIPYFSLKLIYHISCYSKIKLMPSEAWSDVWSVVLVILFVIGLGYCLYLIKKRHA